MSKYPKTQNTSLSLTLSWKRFVVKDIEISLKKIKPKNTMDPDEIPSFFLHDCATVLLNLIHESGLFLAILKKPHILLLYKKGSVGYIKNSRPIIIINKYFSLWNFPLSTNFPLCISGVDRQADQQQQIFSL